MVSLFSIAFLGLFAETLPSNANSVLSRLFPSGLPYESNGGLLVRLSNSRGLEYRASYGGLPRNVSF